MKRGHIRVEMLMMWPGLTRDMGERTRQEQSEGGCSGDVGERKD